MCNNIYHYILSFCNFFCFDLDLVEICTVCPKSLALFYKVTYYIKGGQDFMDIMYPDVS